MATIPDEILHEILVLLPAKSIARFKCVCKSWQHHLQSWDFIQQHLDRALRADPDSSNPSLILTHGSALYIIHDLDLYGSSPSNPRRPIKLALPRAFRHNNGTIKVIGSSNGLICAESGPGLNHYFLFNPYIPGSFKIVPYAQNQLSEQDLAWYSCPKPKLFSGFGFDCRNNDYKIVYGYSNYSWLMADVLVFSLNVGSWKTLKSLPDLKPERWASDGVLLNNRLHWCGFWNENKIVSYDLHDEEWDEIAFPDCEKGYLLKDMVVLKGCLGIVMVLDEHCITRPKLWVMKEYGINESWTKAFTLPVESGFVMYSPWRCQVLLHNARGIGWYDVIEDEIYDKGSAEVDITDSEVKVSKAVCFFGSLVSVSNPIKMLGRVEGSKNTSQERSVHLSTSEQGNQEQE